MDDFECGQEVAEEEDEEGESQHEYLVHPEGRIPQCPGQRRKEKSIPLWKNPATASTPDSQASYESDQQMVVAGE